MAVIPRMSLATLAVIVMSAALHCQAHEQSVLTLNSQNFEHATQAASGMTTGHWYIPASPLNAARNWWHVSSFWHSVLALHLLNRAFSQLRWFNTKKVAQSCVLASSSHLKNGIVAWMMKWIEQVNTMPYQALKKGTSTCHMLMKLGIALHPWRHWLIESSGLYTLGAESMVRTSRCGMSLLSKKERRNPGCCMPLWMSMKVLKSRRDSASSRPQRSSYFETVRCYPPKSLAKALESFLFISVWLLSPRPSISALSSSPKGSPEIIITLCFLRFYIMLDFSEEADASGLHLVCRDL